MIPKPTSEQAVQVLEILQAWATRGWRYEVDPDSYPDLGLPDRVVVYYTDPISGYEWHGGPSTTGALQSTGVNHFDALCQATTVMQVLLEEHPEKP